MLYEHTLFFPEETDLTRAIHAMRLIPREVEFLDREFTELDGTPVLLLQTRARLDDKTCQCIEQAMQPKRATFNVSQGMTTELEQAQQAFDAVPSYVERFRDGCAAWEVITPQDYMQAALRTLYKDLSFRDRLGLCGLGLPGEIGEVVDHIKKYLYHRNGKPLAVDLIKDELGDVLWYYFVLLDTLEISFEEVVEASAEKLKQRHPNGFNPHYASDSHASE